MMTQSKYRAQILLEAEQHQALTEVARRENRSISDLVREIVSNWIDQQNDQRVWEQRMDSLQRLSRIREHIETQYGIYQGDLVAEGRAEREQDDEIVWRGE
jgi:hypothetical protein